MAAAEDRDDLIEEFQRFYRTYYHEEVATLAQGYPAERTSLHVDWNDLFQFNPDLADDLVEQPEQVLRYAEEALRLYDLPIDVKLGQAHVRPLNLPEPTPIRDLRARHVNTLIGVQGIVRKATSVRPKVTEAAFECQRCGTLTHIPQTSADFQEPHECQGCERQGPFEVNVDQSEFVDAQRLRVQESPEGLRGGETPEALDVSIEDDLTGNVAPGDRVTVTGTLKLDQAGDESAIFDVFMDGVSVEIEDEEFEAMDITEEDQREIVELSQESDIYERMVDSIAPSIYGYPDEKLAITLQMFSGVTKHLPDGSRIRGDLHMLLIGDPGTGKCVHGDTKVTLANGEERPIRELVEENLDDPKPVDDGVYDAAEFNVLSFDPDDGSIAPRRATRVWKREAPNELFEIGTEDGRTLVVTPSHPLFVPGRTGFEPVQASRLDEGSSVVVSSETGRRAGTDQPAPVLADGGAGTATITRIESIDRIDPPEPWVYDLEVTPTHSYVSNGIVSHNSQLLQYVREIAPRSVYTSGKGSSAAGLCVTGDTLVHTANGFQEIGGIAQQSHPDPVTEETAAERTIDLYAYDPDDGAIGQRESSHVWRMPEKPCRRIETVRGKTLEASVRTPVLTCRNGTLEWTPISEVNPGDYVAAPRYEHVERSSPPVSEFVTFTNEKVKLADESIEKIRRRLCDRFGTLRNAAAELAFPEDFIYDSLSNRFVPLDRLDRILDAVDATRDDVTIERAMLRHGDPVDLPQRFDAELLYLVGLIFGDGDIGLSRRDGNRGLVRLSNGDERILERAADIIERTFGKRVEIERQEDRVPCIRLHSSTIARLFANLGMCTPKSELALDERLTTADHADAFLRGLFDADGCVSVREDGGSSVQLSTISERLAQQVQLMLETYGVYAKRRERDRRGTYRLNDEHTIESTSVQYHIEIYGRDIDAFAERIGFEHPDKQTTLERIVEPNIRRERSLPLGNTLREVATDGGAGAYRSNVVYGNDLCRDRARKIVENVDLGDAHESIAEVIDANLLWDEVVAAEDTGRKEVFDLTVPEVHNFVGNGIVTHNTAAAVRDDFGDGQQWTLEAGALVLADRGVAAVDELDKMDASDRSALHEGLEQQQISVAKAGINATLKSRCSLLGAANPKYGRFDHYEPIGEQIDLEPALISRFDLIFTVTDQPDEERDTELAEHILGTNFAGELHTQHEQLSNPNYPEERVKEATDEVEPAIEPDLFRKYIAYSKRNCFPTMTEEARDRIQEFYVNLRSKGADDDAPVPVTARKLEALVRLAEASARIRLSDTVELDDAERVIEIVRSCLQDIGVDPETGQFDADVVETGTSKSQRDRVQQIKSLVQDVEDEYDEGAPIDVVLDRAEDIGIERSKAEHEIEKLKQKGELYQPSQDHLRAA